MRFPKLSLLAALSVFVWSSAWQPSAAQTTSGVPARAAPVPEQGPAWSSLSPAQRIALAPLQTEWPRIGAARKEKWVELAARMPAMTPEDRQRVQVRMADWLRMSPAERGRARLQFQETRQFTSQDRQQRWQAYEALPADQRQALAAKATGPTSKAPFRQTAPTPASAPEAKRNLLTLAPPTGTPKSIAPTVIQARPGATTSLVTQPPSPPMHHQTGLPKIAATRGFVDPDTLLPRRGPQGAAVAAKPSTAPSARPASASARK